MKTLRAGGISLAFFANFVAFSEYWIPPSVAAQAPKPGAKRYALLIGVNKYDEPRAIKREANPNFAERDAEQVAEALRGRAFASEDVFVMSTASKRGDEHYPTAANIRRQVKTLAGRLRDGDSVVVSFSGYEMQFAGNDDYYLCTSDADADDLHTLVSLREVCATLDRARGDAKLVIVDSCRIMEKTPGGALTPRLPTGSVGVLFACSKGENAYEPAEKRQGLLSYFIVDGLRGSADGDHDGAISTAELVSFVKGRVLDSQKDQSPELFGPIPPITFAAPDSIRVDPKAVKASGTLHLLAVGINAYPDKRLQLDCAAPDALAIRQAFQTHSRKLFNDIDAKLLLDGQATRVNILGELRRLAAKARPGDVVVVFYAGHGDTRRQGQFYLVPVDADVADLKRTGISGESLKQLIGGLPCTTVLLLDACYAGSIDESRKTRGLPTQGEALRDLVFDAGLVVMCGADKSQEAAEEKGKGFFTQALVEGLAGRADYDHDGEVELDDLKSYVTKRVRALSDREQEPTMSIPSTVRSFPLSRP